MDLAILRIALALASMTTRVAAGRQWYQDLPAYACLPCWGGRQIRTQTGRQRGALPESAKMNAEPATLLLLGLGVLTLIRSSPRVT